MIEFDPTLVHQWLTRSAERHPEKEAIICGRQRLTYSQLDHRADYLACKFAASGLQRSDRVAILLDNCAEIVIAQYAILKAGGAFVILTASTKGSKLRFILQNSGAKILITHVSKADVVKDALENFDDSVNLIWIGPEKGIPTELKDISASWDSLFADFDSAPCDKSILPRIIDVDLACLIYTSGSTGRPKGVISTHHNMISAARSIITYIENEPEDIILDVLPLSFDYGLYQVIMSIMFSGTVVIERSFVYLHKTLQRIAEEKVTGFPIVPTIVAMLLNLQNIESYDFSSLRYLTNTGAALPVEHIRRLRQLLPHVKIFSMFGLTECKRVGYIPPDQLDTHPDSVGRAMPNCETFILDEDGNPLPPGRIGELVIRGSNVMQGYWKAPEQTAAAYKPGLYPADRRLHSGDNFKQDDQGFLYFLGRKDDMIKSRGERISPREIEDILCKMPEVAEAAVIGIPDEILGQAIKAFIVPRPGMQLTEKDIAKYSARNMESFMTPKYIIISKDLPRTPNGKIDKKSLKKLPTESTQKIQDIPHKTQKPQKKVTPEK